MKKADKIVSPFNINGRLAKTYTEKNKIKYIKLVNDQDEYWIKITKQLRKQIAKLSLDCQLEVIGSSKQHPKTRKIKYKAQTIALIPQNLTQRATIKTKQVSLLPVFDSHTKSKAKVLICQKSNCWKKGGKKVFASLESSIDELGLDGVISIKKTGCLKKCKKAPNLVMLPDKEHYTKVKPKEVHSLVEKHLLAES